MLRESEPKASQNSVTMENLNFMSLFSESANQILNVPSLLISDS